jgi:hypothetical protein
MQANVGPQAQGARCTTSLHRWAIGHDRTMTKVTPGVRENRHVCNPKKLTRVK